MARTIKVLSRKHTASTHEALVDQITSFLDEDEPAKEVEAYETLADLDWDEAHDEANERASYEEAFWAPLTGKDNVHLRERSTEAHLASCDACSQVWDYLADVADWEAEWEAEYEVARSYAETLSPCRATTRYDDDCAGLVDLDGACTEAHLHEAKGDSGRTWLPTAHDNQAWNEDFYTSGHGYRVTTRP